jgi:hypothetical protein
MSDKLYAMQYRSMHTAIHNIVIFSAEKTAKELFDYVQSTLNMPEVFEEFDNPKNFINHFEIDYRNPPTRYEYDNDAALFGLELVYVNYPEGWVPDVYNT